MAQAMQSERHIRPGLTRHLALQPSDGEFFHESYAENPHPIFTPKVGADLSEYQLPDLKQDFPRRPFKSE